MNFCLKTAGTIMAALTFSGAASAQYGVIPDVIGATIGNMVAEQREEAQCLSGQLPSPKALLAAREGAEATMRNYLKLAAGGGPADVSPAFTRKTSLRKWFAGDKWGDVAAVRDPWAASLAASGAALPTPVSFIRSGDGQTALGAWAVDSAKSGPAAPNKSHYRVGFRSERGEWKITHMELLRGEQEAPSITQYCHVPGDVEKYQAKLESIEAERQRRKAARAALQAR